MPISSSSTYAEVEAEYRDTADYRLDASATKALRHAAAISHLLILLPSNSVKGANQVSYAMSLLQSQLERAEAYAVAAGSGNATNVIRADFRGMRAHG
jgi:hypothetical protein